MESAIKRFRESVDLWVDSIRHIPTVRNQGSPGRRRPPWFAAWRSDWQIQPPFGIEVTACLAGQLSFHWWVRYPERFLLEDCKESAAALLIDSPSGANVRWIP